MTDFCNALRTYAVAALALVMAVPLPLAAQTVVPPIVKAENLRQVSPHVHVITDGGIAQVPNVGIIVGEKAVLVVDTGLGMRNGATVAAAARQLAGARPIHLVTTHVHPEHDLGAQAFSAETKMIRSTAQEAEIARNGMDLVAIFRRLSASHKELLEGAAFRKADVTFEKDYALDLGGLSVRIMAAGPTHTLGDTAVWIDTDRVLFAGDIAMLGMPSFMGPQSSLGHWLVALDQLDALKPAVIVPSHGPLGAGEYLATTRAYLTEVRDRTISEKKIGWTVEQAIEKVTAAIGNRYPNNRLAGAVAAAYREAP